MTDFTDSVSTFNSESISLVTNVKLSCNCERQSLSCSASSLALKISEHMKHFDCKVPVGSIISEFSVENKWGGINNSNEREIKIATDNSRIGYALHMN